MYKGKSPLNHHLIFFSFSKHRTSKSKLASMKGRLLVAVSGALGCFFSCWPLADIGLVDSNGVRSASLTLPHHQSPLAAEIAKPQEITPQYEGAILLRNVVLGCLQRLGGVSQVSNQFNEPIQFIESYLLND